MGGSSDGAARVRASALCLALAALTVSGPLRAADLGYVTPALGSVRAPLVGYDAYGYPVFAPAEIHAVAPAFGSPACPVGSQPIYDAAGNCVGYGPIRICR